MLDDPHCRENGVAVLAEQPGTPLSPRAGPVLEFSEHSTPVEPAAELGSHSDTILRFLGYADEEIAHLFSVLKRKQVANVSELVAS